MAHVFISYARVDGHFARLLKFELEKAEFDLWIDTERLRVGEDWRQAIDEAIQDSYGLIVLKSPEAGDSQYVTYEWSYALGIGIKIIPILLKPTKFHPRLEIIQHLDFTSTDPSMQPWNALIERLREIRDEQDIGIRLPRNMPTAIKRAVQALDSPNPVDRGSALGSLSQMNHPLAVEALVQALRHPTRDVRYIATCFLAEHHQDVRAKPVLLNMLYRGLSFERIEAAKVANEIWDGDIVKALILCLSDYEQDEKTGEWVCDMAAEALERIGTPEALSAVEEWRRKHQEENQQ